MKRLIRYFSVRSVIKDISAYGYDFSMKKYILAITTGFLVIFGISMIYGLKPVCVIITGLVSISVIPGIIRKGTTIITGLKSLWTLIYISIRWRIHL